MSTSDLVLLARSQPSSAWRWIKNGKSYRWYDGSPSPIELAMTELHGWSIEFAYPRAASAPAPISEAAAKAECRRWYGDNSHQPPSEEEVRAWVASRAALGLIHDKGSAPHG